MRKKTGSRAYAKAGVNLDAGDAFSAFAGTICRGSFGNSTFVKVVDESLGHFRGPRGWQYVGFPPDTFHVGAPDGIGTATILISAAENFGTSASRLVAMTEGDVTRFGGLPLVFINHLDAKRLGQPDSQLFINFQTMMAGLGRIATQGRFVLMGGETAEMSQCVSGEITGPAEENRPTFNWSGVMLGVNHPSMLITGQAVKIGDRIIALRDSLRSNGASLMRRYLRERYGNLWWMNPQASEVVTAMASPAALYGSFLTAINGWYNNFKPIIRVQAIAHLSGGAIRSKLADDVLFQHGLSAVLDNLWEPPQFMLDCVSHFEMPDQEAYTVLNGGQGLLAIVRESDVDGFCEKATQFGIEARNAGYIDKQFRVPRLQIRSGFSGKLFTMKRTKAS
ncbi:MAG: AIR synthase-related protein [Candidatus Paceibacterota bacterium]